MDTTYDSERKNHNVGVIVGRFQVPTLHEAHKALIREVNSNHQTLIVVLGVSQSKFTRSNPLPFKCRMDSIKLEFPNAIILPLKDDPSDKEWVNNLDNLINAVTTEQDSIILYGSRDSFLDSYLGNSGMYDVCELIPDMVISGTQIRSDVKKQTINSVDFRMGIIYCIENGFNN